MNDRMFDTCFEELGIDELGIDELGIDELEAIVAVCSPSQILQPTAYNDAQVLNALFDKKPAVSSGKSTSKRSNRQGDELSPVPARLSVMT